jgi:hypothetical protein
VSTLNVALVDPVGTVTLGGTVIGSPADNDTTAPPFGAGPVSVAVPVRELPPTTLDALREREPRATDDAPTDKAADCRLLPLADAVITAVPVATAETVNVAVGEPAGTVIDAGTVATLGLLLDNDTVVSDDAVSESVRRPCTCPPTSMFSGLRATLDTEAVRVVGTVGELPLPQWVAAIAATNMAIVLIEDRTRC